MKKTLLLIFVAMWLISGCYVSRYPAAMTPPAPEGTSAFPGVMTKSGWRLDPLRKMLCNQSRTIGISLFESRYGGVEDIKIPPEECRPYRFKTPDYTYVYLVGEEKTSRGRHVFPVQKLPVDVGNSSSVIYFNDSDFGRSGGPLKPLSIY